MPRKDTEFRKGDPRTKEAGRKGGLRRAEKVRGVKPFSGSVLDLAYLCGLSGESWSSWHVFLKAVHGIAMTEDERQVFERHTLRQEPPARPVSEVWLASGRRSGKSRIAALMALHRALSFDSSSVAAGEQVICPTISADRKQSRTIQGYVRGWLELPALRKYLDKALKERIGFTTGCAIETLTCSMRTVRGYTIPFVAADEIAFWLSTDTGANPDSEVVGALRPALATVEGGLFMALSSPYAPHGELFSMSERHYGTDDPEILFWNSCSRSMNPLLDVGYVERAFLADPARAASEFGEGGHVAFREDVQGFLDLPAIKAVTVTGRRELPPRAGLRYAAFCDPAGGSGSDAFTICIAHQEGGRAVLDCLRERRPRFSPDEVCAEFASLLRSYGLSRVTSDRFAHGWVKERFSRHGITVEYSSKPKSALYAELLPLVNSGTCELLDIPALHHQLATLERRVSRAGKDSIDHRSGARDDSANSAAGALVLVAPQATTGRQAYFGSGDGVVGGGRPGRDERRERLGLYDSGPSQSITIGDGWWRRR